jgi:hypothetical protein
VADTGSGAALRWSIRASFFRYVAGLHDGRASVSDGAILTTDDPQLVVFPADVEESDEATLAFRGDLRLAGHGGLLFVRLANPRITRVGEQAADVAELSVDDPLTEDGTGPRLTLVTLTLVTTDEGWTGIDVRLTGDGVALFNHVYPAGDAFDDLRLVGSGTTR